MANTSLKSLANFEGVTSGSFKDVISKCVAPPPPITKQFK